MISSSNPLDQKCLDELLRNPSKAKGCHRVVEIRHYGAHDIWNWVFQIKWAAGTFQGAIGEHWVSVHKCISIVVTTVPAHRLGRFGRIQGTVWHDSCRNYILGVIAGDKFGEDVRFVSTHGVASARIDSIPEQSVLLVEWLDHGCQIRDIASTYFG